jgi:hypothetical protein
MLKYSYVKEDIVKMKGLKQKVTLLLVLLIVLSNVTIAVGAKDTETISKNNTIEKVVINDANDKSDKTTLINQTFAKSKNAKVSSSATQNEILDTAKNIVETGKEIITNTIQNVVDKVKNAVATKPSAKSTKLSINIKKTYKTKIPVGTVKKLKIKNQEGKLKVTSSDTSVIRITKNNNLKAKKPGKATITIKTNGITIKRKVKSALKLKISYNPKNKIKLNVGQSKKIRKLYTYTTNLDSLKKFVSLTKYSKYVNKVDDKAENPTATVENKKYAKISGKKINAKNKGKTSIKVKCGKQSFNVPITITKLAETTFKGKKAKIAYSASQAYEYYKKALTEFYIKGEKPDYRYVKLAYANNKSWNTVEEELEKEITKNFDQNDNFYSIEHHLSYCNNERKDDNGVKYWDNEVYSATELKDLKKLYDESQKIFESININAFDEDYEKLIALHFWFKKNVYYHLEGKDRYYGKIFGKEKAIIYKHIGVCSDYAWATDYFCALLKIPSISTGYYSDSNHEWNIVKVQDSWYHLDNLNGVLFYGNKDIRKLALRNEGFKLTKYYTSEKWEERVAYDVLPQITKDKLKEIAYACGITTDKYNIYVWNYPLDESGWIIEEPQSS